MAVQFRVTDELYERNPLHPTYPLLPGDIVTLEDGGAWMKHAPGLAVGGFILTSDDIVDSLEPADDARWAIG